MRIIVEIATVGMLVLFAALAALVGLMYLLTSPSVFGDVGRERRRARRMRKRGESLPEPAASAAQSEVSAARDSRSRIEEHNRRRRAAGLAAAVARAGGDRPMVFKNSPDDWRLLHRNLRLNQRVRSKP